MNVSLFVHGRRLRFMNEPFFFFFCFHMVPVEAAFDGDGNGSAVVSSCLDVRKVKFLLLQELLDVDECDLDEIDIGHGVENGLHVDDDHRQVDGEDDLFGEGGSKSHN